MKPQPIVSLSGPPELHEAAAKYNSDLARLGSLERDMEDAIAWNARERFGSGFFAQTKPPVPTANHQYSVNRMIQDLEKERARIVLESEGSVRP